MRKAIIFIITTFSIILGITSFSKKIDAETLDIKGLTRNEFLDSSGMGHGKNHDRYDLGKVMKKGSQIKISSSQAGTLNLLSDDRNTEKEYKIGPKEQTITADHDSVPFIQTPINGTNIKVNYEFIGNTQELAIFNSGDNQKEFLDNWEKTQSLFALFKGEKFQLFLPIGVYDSVKNMSSLKNGFKDIQSMMNHYDNVLFPLYEKLTKLDNSNEQNKLDNNRFFLKNDGGSGGGEAAYYNDSWTADSSKNGTMWLQNEWGHEHEIGHGFQNDLMRQMGMGEVSNNILGAYYDFQKFGTETDNEGWIFSYGKRDVVENELSNQLKAGKTFSHLNEREKLILIYFLLNKLDANGDGISKINESSRDINLFNIFDDQEVSLNNKLLGLANSKGYDYGKILSDYGFNHNSKTFLYNGYFSQKTSVVDSIASLIAPENRDQVTKKLMELYPEIKSQSMYNLFTPEQLSPLGLKGSAYISFEGALPDELLNTKLNVFDGNKLVDSKKLTDKDGVAFNELPLGTYRLEFEGIKPGMYIDNNYLTVSQNGADSYNEESTYVHVNKVKFSNLAVSNDITFEGLGDDPFMYVNTELWSENNVKIVTDFFSKDPHMYFAGEKYASLFINDGYSDVINKTILGDSKDTFRKENILYTDPFETKINMYHAEPSRLKVVNAMGKKLSDNNSKENNFTLNSYGLTNDKDKDSTKNLKSIILYFGEKYMVDKNINSGKNRLIEDLYSAIDALPKDEAKPYFDRYKKLFDLYK